MKIQKKFFLFMFVMALALLLTACNEDEGGANADTGDKDTGSAEASGNAQGVTDDEILIGHLGPQTGPTAIYDLTRKGVDSYFKYVNENGGVNGRKLKLIAYDDQYQPAKAVQLAQRLVEEDKVFAMVGNVGSANTLAIKDYITDKGVPMVLTGVGLTTLYDPPIKNFMGSGIMNYRLEAEIYLDYAVNKLDAKTLAIAYQDDDLGKEGYQAVKNAIAKYPDAEIVEEVTFLPQDTEFSSQAQKLNKVNPDVVFYFGSPNPAANLKKAMYKIGLTEPAYIVAAVGGNDNNLFNLAGAAVWEGSYSSSIMPNAELFPDDEQVKIFIERFGKDYPKDPLAGFGQYGWGYAQVLVEAIERAGDDLSWDNFLETFYSFDKWEGSLYTSITLGEDNHYAVTSMFMTQATDGQIQPITGAITIDPATKEIEYED